MKKAFLIFLVPLCLGLMGMESCFPGDGYPNPDAYSVSGHGPGLNYEDNGDGAFTDEVTKFMWELKTGTPDTFVNCDDPDNLPPSCEDPHDVNNRYTWTDSGNGDKTDPDGTLFTVFLEQINNTCEGEGMTKCDNDIDCAKGEKCGLAGYRDWCIPNVKGLLSIVNYSMCDGCNLDTAATSVPGATNPGNNYWSITTDASTPDGTWTVRFSSGNLARNEKDDKLFARAVRPCK